MEIRNKVEPKRLVESLFLGLWEGGENSYWAMLEGMNPCKHVLSDHLFNLFGKWSESFVGIVPSFEQLYDTWEMMGSLTYCERYTLEGLQAAMSNKGGTRGYSWMPVGRSGWNIQASDRIIRLIQNDDVKQSLLEAGFGKGQSDFFEAAIDNFKRMADRIQLELELRC